MGWVREFLKTKSRKMKYLKYFENSIFRELDRDEITSFGEKYKAVDATEYDKKRIEDTFLKVIVEYALSDWYKNPINSEISNITTEIIKTPHFPYFRPNSLWKNKVFHKAIQIKGLTKISYLGIHIFKDDYFLINIKGKEYSSRYYEADGWDGLEEVFKKLLSNEVS